MSDRYKHKTNIYVGAHSLNQIPSAYRHRVGNLFSPGGIWNSKLPFALDNGVYAAHKNQVEWDELKFIAHLDKCRNTSRSPLWVVVPDRVGDADTTTNLWHEWAPKIECDYGYPLAFAAQDGHTPKDVPQNAAIVFLGGSTEWKRNNIALFARECPRLHVGRINTYTWLWYCHKCKVESIDGTGWFWQRKREWQDLLDYLAITEGHCHQESNALFPIYKYSNPLISR